MPAPTRRALLRASAVAVPLSLAGCTNVGYDSRTRKALIFFNEPNAAHTIHIAVAGENGNLAEDSVHLEADGQSEYLRFGGDPSTVTIHVDGRHRATFDWDPYRSEFFDETYPNGCPSGETTVVKLFLGQSYPSGDGTILDAGNGIHYGYTCEDHRTPPR